MPSELDVFKAAVAGFDHAAYDHHLQSKLSLRNYQRIADAVMRVVPRGRLLDWGAHRGQMAWLLTRRGLTVVPYDYRPDQTGVRGEWLPLSPDVPLVTSGDAVALPFRNASFDAVLSSGVLEHVDDERGSLHEIRRVLVPGGRLLIFQLPQQWSYNELIVRSFKLGYAHERRYTAAGIAALLEAAGFVVEQVGRANMLPKNFTGLPRQAQALFDLAPDAVLAADVGLSQLPGLNQVAGALEVVARKPL
jgi:ubiquinone/menaquinone biosynthesis C-methylase UbiE